MLYIQFNCFYRCWKFEPICKTEQKSYYPTVKKSSDEEFTARIVTTIIPYLNENLSDNAFLNLQKHILQVLKEYRKECRK